MMVEYLLFLVVGYIIGLMQKGIKITHKTPEPPKEYNKSIGIDEFKQYYEETDGANMF